MHGEYAEIILELQNGEYQIAASPVMADQKINGVALIVYDITERRRSEQMRREFTANVSHEMKTPLQSISGYAEIIKNNLVKPEDIPQCIEHIYEQSQRLIALIDDVISLSQLDEQKIDLSREQVDLYQTAENVIKELSTAADNKQVSISLHGDHAKFSGIPQLVYEIIYNLCDNAIKYNKENGQVVITITSHPDKLQICVADTGIGISSEDKTRVFERFYRGDKSHSQKITGTGLGLSIVKHAARLHQAQIDLVSEPGQGTTICIDFPKQA